MMTGCGAAPSGETAGKNVAQSAQAEDATGQKRKIIIDMDSGGDDAVALIMAARAEDVDLLGVTVSEGNVTLAQAVDNALMTLEMAGSDVPVYAGANTTYTGKERAVFSVYGKDGMGDKDLIHPKRKAENGNAVDFIIDTVKANPGEVEIVALGPVTNLALAIKKAPEVMKRVKRFWSMGTAGFGDGNATPVAEFNVYHDAEAYKVFAGAGVPITALGFDLMSKEVRFEKEELDELAKMGGLQKYVADSFSGLVRFNSEKNGAAFADCPDGLLMACAIWDGFIKDIQPCHASVMTDDDETYGQVILYKKGVGYDTGVTFDSYDFNVITDIDDDVFKEKLCSVLEK